MFKIGLIGCGKISAGHVNAFETIDDAKIIAACDLLEENLNAVCEKTGARAYYDYKEMVGKEEPDLVVINLPHGLHCEATCFCAEQGVDVFLEKPMGISSDDCRKMIDVCKKNGVMLWVGHLQRYMPANKFAKELIDSGELGTLVGFSEVRNGEYFTPNRPKWFGVKSMSGGGIAINLGAHCLDKLKFFSDSEIEDICGSIHIHDGLDCEDSVQAFVKMKNGVVGTMNLIGYTTQNVYETVLYLTNGEIKMRLEDDNCVYYAKKGEEFSVHILDEVPGMTYQMQDVVRVLREGKREPVVGGEYGLDVVHAIKKLYGEEK